jgi:hypothetical protein
VNLLRNARISSDNTSPSASHLACAACQSSSSTRSVRIGRGALGIDGHAVAAIEGEPAVTGHVGDADADDEEPAATFAEDVLDRAVDDVLGGDVVSDDEVGCGDVHTDDCTHERIYAQGVG